MRILRILSLLFGLAIAQAHALRPGIPKVTGFTDHFSLTIDESKSDLLPKLAAIAEECWAKQSAFFGYSPDGRIQMVFLDEQDYANGYAYSPQKWVVIHMHSAEHLLRGRTRWLEGVMAHEIGHIFTLRMMGENSRFLGVGIHHAWLGRGPSAFYGSLSYIHREIPPWLAEGLAQYAAGVCGFDTLDTRRAMALRVAAASGRLLTLAELKAFAWDGRRNEMIYAQGYSLVRFLYATYGTQAVNGYLYQAGRSGWRGAFEKSFGKSLADIHDQWRKGLEAGAHWEARGDGEYMLPQPAGTWSVETFPTPLRDGRLLYLSARDNDHGSTDLFLGEVSGSTRKLLQDATSIRLDPDGRTAYVTAVRFAFLRGDVASDLWAFDIESGKLERLTSGGRIIRGSGADGAVYGIRNDQGRTSLVKLAGGAWTTVYSPPDTLELIDVAPGRGPGSLTLGTTSGFGSDLREYDLTSGELTPLAISPQEEIDPHWSGDTLYFSADYDGGFEIYALAGDKVERLTHVDGGAFHPFPRPEGLWLSAYGPAGFRLARAPRASATPDFTVQLPMPGWKAPALLEYEADSYDHSRLGLLGFDVNLGVTRTAGYRSAFTDSSTGDVHVNSSEAGNRAEAGVGMYFKNPNGVMDARINLGLSRPLDYEGPMHLDRTGFEGRVRAFLPEFVASLMYSTYDFPGFRIDSLRTPYYGASLDGELGFDLRLAEHWLFAGRGLFGQDFAYLGREGEKASDSDPRMGGSASLDYFNIQSGRDGVVKGFSAFIDGGKPPMVSKRVPELAFNSGATVYASLNRMLFARGSLYHTQEVDVDRSWLYGSALAYCAVPVGMQLGTRGGAGLYLDQVRPALAYREMARLISGGTASSSWRPEPAAMDFGAGPAPRALWPGHGFLGMLNRETSHEVGFGLQLKAVSFFATTQLWSAFVNFDALDFGREPTWSVSLSL